ncbi:MAG: hypothetical protein QNJ46_12225 [Leptolyngbyaceae cyanobacterium MO_188.B28]|nr:hypothetical protein [Leptolyngbyaceae cyanobacterium MO_188.B28]
MFSWLERLIIYVRIRPNWLSVRGVTKQGKAVEYADIPQVILQPSGKAGSFKILEVGSATKAFLTDSPKEIIQCNGFSHPRTVISDFNIALNTLQTFIRTYIRQVD